MRRILIVPAILLGLATGVDAQSLTGQVQTVVVARGETLRSIGSRLGSDPATIARDNGRTLNQPLAAGETLTVDNRHIVPTFDGGVSIVINVPQRMLFTMTSGGARGFPVAVGRADWPTPLGAFSIATKETNPTWDVPLSIREEAQRAGRPLPLKVPPGPGNPLGAYWMGLSAGSVGIHGTNAPRSIYQVVTHGCIRLHPDDIAVLFAQVPVGATGVLLYQPILVATEGSAVFVEAHRDPYGRGPGDGLEFIRARTLELGVFDLVDWGLAAEVIRERAGVARAVTR